METVTVETEGSERFIRHAVTCDACGGSGLVLGECGHDGCCPCSVAEVECETCEGRGVVCDDCCNCERCEALAEQEGLT